MKDREKLEAARECRALVAAKLAFLTAKYRVKRNALEKQLEQMDRKIKSAMRKASGTRDKRGRGRGSDHDD